MSSVSPEKRQPGRVLIFSLPPGEKKSKKGMTVNVNEFLQMSWGQYEWIVFLAIACPIAYLASCYVMRCQARSAEKEVLSRRLTKI
jgi:hypothetical protein